MALFSQLKRCAWVELRHSLLYQVQEGTTPQDAQHWDVDTQRFGEPSTNLDGDKRVDAVGINAATEPSPVRLDGKLQRAVKLFQKRI